MKKNHENLLVLDFDHTLFNTTKFVKYWKKEFLNLGITKEAFTKHRQSIKDCCSVIDIDNFTKSFPEFEFKILHDKTHKIIREISKDCIFSDVSKFLENHKKNFDILIATHGDCELQSEKIKHSHLPDYVQHYISTKSKAEVLKMFKSGYKKIVLIEDKTMHIDEVKQIHPEVITYHLQRPEDMPYGNIQSKCECTDFVIKNLNFIIK